MIEEEADVIVALLVGNWFPVVSEKHKVSDATITVWQQKLGALDFASAMNATNMLISNPQQRYFPQWSDFQLAYDAVIRREQTEQPALPEEGEATKSTMPSPEQVQANIDELRAVIAGAGTRDRDRAMLGRRPPTTKSADPGHDPRRCKACLVNEDRAQGAVHVPTINENDVALLGDPDVPEPPPDYDL